MCPVHYTEGAHLICEWEADKQSCYEDREEFGWLRDIWTKKTKQKLSVRAVISHCVSKAEKHSLWNAYLSIS